VQRDVVRRVARRVDDRERAVAEGDPLAGGDAADAVRRARNHRAVERAHSVLPVRARGARHQPVRIDEMPCTDLVHPDRRAGVPLEERTDAAGVIHVDVGDDDVRQLVRLDAEPIQRNDDAVVVGARSRLDQRRLGRLDEIDRVQLALARHHRVDRSDAVTQR
jgi:hypothetical protein